MLKTYDPSQVVITVGGAIISGYADGAFITLSRNSDMFSRVAGADGENARVKSSDKSGKVTLTLMQTSDSNDILTGFAAADELANSGVVPFAMKDISGRTVALAPRAWVTKLPDSEFGKEAGTREWVLEMDELDMFVGGTSKN